jgi:chromosome condensin MukBEF ATPase and DNA-binding subunit MukB
MIVINLDKAKAITKDRLRQERTPLLQALDVAQLRNLADPVALADIEAKKQVLRDATKQVDSLTTLDELKAAQLPNGSQIIKFETKIPTQISI